MSDKKCPNCSQLLASDDLVCFEGLGRYVALKSQVRFALKQPLEGCENVRHQNCNTPQGGCDADN